MLHINHPDHFPALKLEALRAQAEQWAARWWQLRGVKIKRIILSRQTYLHDKEYLLWAQVDCRAFESYEDFLTFQDEWLHFKPTERNLPGVFKRPDSFSENEWFFWVQLLNGPPTDDPWWGSEGKIEEKVLFLISPTAGDGFASKEFWWELYRKEGESTDEQFRDFIDFPDILSVDEYHEEQSGWQAYARLGELSKSEQEIKEGDIQLERKSQYLKSIRDRKEEINAWLYHDGPLPVNIEEEITTTDVITSLIEKENQGNRFAFIKEGPTWTIVYEGIVSRGHRGKGFEVIHFLVRNQGDGFNAYRFLDTPSVQLTENQEISRNEFVAETGGKRNQRSRIRKTPQKVIKEIEEKISDFKARLEEAKKNGDIQAREELENKLDEYRSHLKQAKGYFTTPEDKKTTSTVGIQIRRAIDNMKKTNMSLGEHFEKCIKPMYSLVLSYRPDRKIEWRTG